MSVSIIGTGHTEVGNLEKDIYELIEKAGKEALENASINPAAVGGIWLANFSGGSFNNQEHLAPYALNIHPELASTPAVRIENACASGSAAIDEARKAVELGEVDFALVIGVEKMSTVDTKDTMKILSKASYWPEEGAEGITFPGLFAEFASSYSDFHGLEMEKLREIFARIAAKNHRNAGKNPLAQMPWDCTYEDILNLPDDKNPVIAPPLRMYDCSLISDGAAALVMTNSEIASRKKQKVDILNISHTTDYLSLENKSNHKFTAGKKAVKAAYQKTGLTVNDLDFAEVHDCFTIAELLSYETLGLTEDGEGTKAVEEGWTEADGCLPVNPSGGLKAKGHPVGATGVSMAVLCTRQLLDNPLGVNIEGAEIGASYNIGGSAASNYFIIYQRG